MRVALSLTALLLVGNAFAINNAAAKPSFADLTWYSNRQVVKAQMLKKGYDFVGERQDANAVDTRFAGKLLGIPVTIQHFFNNSNQLVKTSIVFENSYDGNLFNNWKSVRDSINGKYGLGKDYSTALRDGGYAYNFQLESDLRSGKELSYGWFFPVNSYSISLDVTQIFINNEDYYLNLAYESPAWGKELKRRQVDGDF